MSSKKKHRKKAFKRPATRAVSAPVMAMPSAAISPIAQIPTPVASSQAAISARPEPTSEQALRLTRIKRDVRRALVLAGGFIALQLVLWYVFGHTGLGNSVYNLVKF